MCSAMNAYCCLVVSRKLGRLPVNIDTRITYHFDMLGRNKTTDLTKCDVSFIDNVGYV